MLTRNVIILLLPAELVLEPMLAQPRCWRWSFSFQKAFGLNELRGSKNSSKIPHGVEKAIRTNKDTAWESNVTVAKWRPRIAVRYVERVCCFECRGEIRQSCIRMNSSYSKKRGGRRVVAVSEKVSSDRQQRWKRQLRALSLSTVVMDRLTDNVWRWQPQSTKQGAGGGSSEEVEERKKETTRKTGEITDCLLADD